MANLTFIPNAVSKSSTGTIALDDISDEVKKDVEEVYEALKTNPGRMRVNFDTVQQLNQYVAQVKEYCRQRPQGAIHFRKSPSRGLPATTMDFRIVDVPVNEEITQDIRTGVDAVKAAAK
jgi:hypothetical protein